MNKAIESNKGIKGRLRTKFKEEYLKNIEENKEVFAGVIERDFLCAVEYDIYTASFENKEEDYIVIDFNLLSSTFGEVKKYLTQFKKEIYNHFGFKAENYFSAQYEKI